MQTLLFLALRFKRDLLYPVSIHYAIFSFLWHYYWHVPIEYLMIAFSLQVRGIVDDLVNDFLNLQFPEALPMMEKDAY